jgi:hypothetical protein
MPYTWIVGYDSSRSRAIQELAQNCLSLRRHNHGAAAEVGACLLWENDSLLRETTPTVVPPDFGLQRMLRFPAKLKS